MINAEEVYIKFAKDWQKVGLDLSWNARARLWTERIFRYFYDEGKKRELEIYINTNIIREAEGEYLVDLCWSREDKKDNYYGLELALESEWERTEKAILEDFYKLVDIKSSLKIMIISPQEKIVEDIIQRMSKIIADVKIKIPDEEYLVIVFMQDKNLPVKERIEIRGFWIDNKGAAKALQKFRFPDY